MRFFGKFSYTGSQDYGAFKKPSSNRNHLENILFDEDVLPWRHLEDVLIQKNIFALVIRLQDLFKTSWSWSRRIYSSWLIIRHRDIFKKFSRCLQDVFPRCLQNVFKKFCKNIFKTSLRRLVNVFKTSCKDVYITSSRCFQDASSS